MLNVKSTANPIPFVPSTGYNVSTHGSDSTFARANQPSAEEKGMQCELAHELSRERNLYGILRGVQCELAHGLRERELGEGRREFAHELVRVLFTTPRVCLRAQVSESESLSGSNL